MKNLFSILSISAMIFISSCDLFKKEEVKEEPKLPQGWVLLDLTEEGKSYGLPLLMNAPGEDLAKGKTEINEGPMAGTKVSIGQNFSIEILPAVGDVASKKAEIESNGLYKTTYLTDTPELIVYKSEIEGAEVSQYHFFTLIKVGNTTYEVSDVTDGDYSEAAISMMVEAAKSLKEKPKAEEKPEA